jgi:hypothetical protein
MRRMRKGRGKKRLLPLMPILTFSTALSAERATYKQQPPRSHKNKGLLVGLFSYEEKTFATEPQHSMKKQ